VEHFSDPGFQVARTLTQMFGLAVMRLADAQVLPFRYSHYARKISEYLDGAASWTQGPDGNEIAKLDLISAKTLAAEIAVRADALEHRMDADLEAGRGTDEARAAWNDRLSHLEQTLLDESETPTQRWYRHVIYGWNIYSLYEGQPLPGLAEAIRVRDPARIALETARIEGALRRMRDELVH
jgi:N-acetylated-alpha-linked acidic dipeptidase